MTLEDSIKVIIEIVDNKMSEINAKLSKIKADMDYLYIMVGLDVDEVNNE